MSSGYGDPEGTNVEARKRPVPYVEVPTYRREPGYALAVRFWLWVFALVRVKRALPIRESAHPVLTYSATGAPALRFSAPGCPVLMVTSIASTRSSSVPGTS